MKPILVLAVIGLFIWLGVAGIALLARSTLGQGRDFGAGNLVSMSFVDPDHGWSVASACNGADASTASACRSEIYSTLDGGKTWASLGQILLSPHRLSFVNREVGWLVGSVGQQCGSDVCQNVVMLTDDGGKTWNRVSTVSADLTDVAAVSPDDFWAVGRACRSSQSCTGALVHTTSGGQLWDNTPLPIDGVDLRTGRLSAADGWVARADAGPASASLAMTRNGGQTWATLATPCPASGVLVDFTSVANGWLVCSPARPSATTPQTAYRTSDGGVSWQLVGNVPGASPSDGSQGTPESPGVAPAPSGSFARAVQAVQTGNAWIVLGSGTLVRAIEAPGPKDLRVDERAVDVRFVDDQHGWLLGATRIWRTVDGGVSWEPARVLPNRPA